MHVDRKAITRWTVAVVVLVTLYAGYMFLFFAWLTATPLPREDILRAQHHAYGWFAVLLSCILILIGLSVRALVAPFHRT